MTPISLGARGPERAKVKNTATDELGQQHDRRQRNPQAGQDDVEPECEGHLTASRQHLGMNRREQGHNGTVRPSG
jgi:hypothetical protein